MPEPKDNREEKSKMDCLVAINKLTGMSIRRQFAPFDQPYFKSVHSD